jgi:excisionase family DNA binding protein
MSLLSSETTPGAAMQPDLLTPAQVADLLTVPAGTLQQWRHRRVGPPFVHVGRRVRYRRAAVLAWLEAQESSSPRTA